MHDETSRQIIDVAVGVLIGLRGCTRREAFDELVHVVHQTGAGLGTVAGSLVALATGTSSVEDAAAFAVWGELIRRTRPLAAVS